MVSSGMLCRVAVKTSNLTKMTPSKIPESTYTYKIQRLFPLESDQKSKHVKSPTPPLQTSQETSPRSSVEKAHSFAKHLADVFQPHPTENEPEEEELFQIRDSPCQLEPPIKLFKRAEVQEVISRLISKKSSGYDLITGEILKELLLIGIKYLTELFSAVLLKGYLPAQWKVAQVILFLKLGKPPNEWISCWRISLLPIVPKVFEKLILNRPLKMDENNRFISSH
jgi:hypothetical protein